MFIEFMINRKQFPLAALMAGCVLAQTTVDLRTQSKSVDFSQASFTRPSKTGTSLPAACLSGETFFKMDAPAGRNLYGCTSANVWTQIGGDLGVVSYSASFAASTSWTIAGVTHGLGTCDLAFEFLDTSKSPPERVEADKIQCEPVTRNVTVSWASPQAGEAVLVKGGGANAGLAGVDAILGAASISGAAGRVLVGSGTPGTATEAGTLHWNPAAQRLSVGLANGTSTLTVKAPAEDVTVASFGRDNAATLQSLVEIRASQSTSNSGNETGRGAIRLIDNVAVPNRVMELGFYEFGGGIFLDQLFELWARGISIRDTDGSAAPFLAVRDQADSSDVRMRHDGTQGIIETTGPAGGGVRVGGGGPVTISSSYGTVAVFGDSGRVLVGATDDGSHKLQVDGGASFLGNVMTSGPGGGYRVNSRFGEGDWQIYVNLGSLYIYDHAAAADRATLNNSGMVVAGSVDGTSFKVGGVAGLNQAITVRTGDGSGTCTITVSQGIVTATTCP